MWMNFFTLLLDGCRVDEDRVDIPRADERGYEVWVFREWVVVLANSLSMHLIF